MFIANAFLSFARFSYTRALESLTAVVPRLDRGCASFRLVSTAVHTRRYGGQNANTIPLVSDLYCSYIHVQYTIEYKISEKHKFAQ